MFYYVHYHKKTDKRVIKWLGPLIDWKASVSMVGRTIHSFCCHGWSFIDKRLWWWWWWRQKMEITPPEFPCYQQIEGGKHSVLLRKEIKEPAKSGDKHSSKLVFCSYQSKVTSDLPAFFLPIQGNLELRVEHDTWGVWARNVHRKSPSFFLMLAVVKVLYISYIIWLLSCNAIHAWLLMQQ